MPSTDRTPSAATAHLTGCDGVWPCSCVTRVMGVEPTAEMLREMRVSDFDKSDCPNGPDEHGDWPCDPKVLLGGKEAECQTCGRVAAWPQEAS